MGTLLDRFDSPLIRPDLTSRIPGSLSIPHSNNRLPQLELPKFEGNPNDWLTFKDMFSALFLNNITLSSIEKLQYLKNSLHGSAAFLLKHTSLVNKNFQTSWNDLVSYYNNKRILIDNALHVLFSLKPIQKESAAELEFLFTAIQQTIRTLETLEQPVNHWDSILIYLTVRCLDPSSVRNWELELGSST